MKYCTFYLSIEHELRPAVWSGIVAYYCDECAAMAVEDGELEITA